MKFIKVVLIFLLSVVMIAVIFLATMTVLEYRPKAIEEVSIENNQEQSVLLDTEMTIMTFNMGYAGLGEDEDFVMDGGTKGIPESKDVVSAYFEGIKQVLSDYPADFHLMQEVDLKARRSYKTDQVLGITNHLGETYSTQFAYNFKSPFVPFPVSLTDYIGYVESGIATYTTYRIDQATRYQFPGSFSWPLRVANLKRAMMVSILDIEGSTKELHIVNLHMSAYDASGTLREQEMAFLKTYLEEQQTLGNYVIIGGDFNQTFPDAKDLYPVKDGLWEAYPIEADFLPEGYHFEIDTHSPTCRLLNQPYDPNDEDTQYYIIDGFIVSNNIEVLAYDGTNIGAKTINLDFSYSDHNPVILKFKLI
ncbi:MAG: hypothetical protein A2Y45_01625 [Tenericutes bacterium GWC2_34_14]|nr:MAG: hypothetical protein A2Y45_01625 [Tenericutes bacterium GWC2_34_14]OHE33140.1 MAG: hypothetical protein A2012_00455 [Tenericutes bacterium GWE2_34_108]OHE36260.1 MAG: hypothetical protein A2Y46_07445 [Tenericutes bacterium GWF1_35_14]OHE38698.1 MAG: hypothetical protein A2Y44_04785 [Tenericutes bacterium GWF2_35_184]OHE44802.1 MAG: hypothetical protein A2221_01110 [Tenericutes bacterium RIFOXYA2_FULL_36_32]OHE47863.1 MAG: hypothetical protein A3K26_03365 [Tenericutes bacterium RIFOXYA1